MQHQFSLSLFLYKHCLVSCNFALSLNSHTLAMVAGQTLSTEEVLAAMMASPAATVIPQAHRRNKKRPREDTPEEPAEDDVDDLPPAHRAFCSSNSNANPNDVAYIRQYGLSVGLKAGQLSEAELWMSVRCWSHFYSQYF